MAYICGIVTKEERAKLEKLGCDIEPCPESLFDDDGDPDHEWIMVMVDRSLFGVLEEMGWFPIDEEEWVDPGWYS